MANGDDYAANYRNPDDPTQDLPISPEEKAALAQQASAQMSALETQLSAPGAAAAPTDLDWAKATSAQVAARPAIPARLPAQIVPPGNRTYFGPQAGDPMASPREFFQDAPSGTVINRMGPPPVLSPDQQSALQSRLAAGTRPAPNPNITGEQFAAQEGYRRAIESGIPQDVAARIYLPPLLKGQVSGAMTPYQSASLEERKRQFGILHPPTTTGTTAPAPQVSELPGLPGYKAVQTGPKTWHLVNTTTGEAKPVTPAQAGTMLQKIIQSEFGGRTNELSALKPALQQIMQGGLPKAQAPVAAPAATPQAGKPTSAKREVTRLTKDGRTAVFDADSKKFLRYAD